MYIIASSVFLTTPSPSPPSPFSVPLHTGYPVMLKASTGEGRKGMRIAWNEKEVRERFNLVPEEARSVVNHNCMLIEKFIDKPRQNMGECVCVCMCATCACVCVFTVA